MAYQLTFGNPLEATQVELDTLELNVQSDAFALSGWLALIRFVEKDLEAAAGSAASDRDGPVAPAAAAKAIVPIENRLNVTFERALQQLPYSYKLWVMYLGARIQQAHYHFPRNPTHPAVLAVNSVFERSIERLPMLPRLWLMYAEYSFVVCRRLAETRQIYERALRTLPVTQHLKIWNCGFKNFAQHPAMPVEVSDALLRHFLLLQERNLRAHLEYLLFLEEHHSEIGALRLLQQVVHIYHRFRRTILSSRSFWYSAQNSLAAFIRFASEGRTAQLDAPFVARVEEMIRAGIHYCDPLSLQLWIGLSSFFSTLGDFTAARRTLRDALRQVIGAVNFQQIFSVLQSFELELLHKFLSMEDAGLRKRIFNRLYGASVRETISHVDDDRDAAVAFCRWSLDQFEKQYLEAVIREDPTSVPPWLRCLEFHVAQGSPPFRFREDALRALQATRFSASSIDAQLVHQQPRALGGPGSLFPSSSGPNHGALAASSSPGLQEEDELNEEGGGPGTSRRYQVYLACAQYARRCLGDASAARQALLFAALFGDVSLRESVLLLRQFVAEFVCTQSESGSRGDDRAVAEVAVATEALEDLTSLAPRARMETDATERRSRRSSSEILSHFQGLYREFTARHAFFPEVPSGHRPPVESLWKTPSLWTLKMQLLASQQPTRNGRLKSIADVLQEAYHCGMITLAMLMAMTQTFSLGLRYISPTQSTADQNTHVDVAEASFMRIFQRVLHSLMASNLARAQQASLVLARHLVRELCVQQEKATEKGTAGGGGSSGGSAHLESLRDAFEMIADHFEAAWNPAWKADFRLVPETLRDIYLDVSECECKSGFPNRAMTVLQRFGRLCTENARVVLSQSQKRDLLNQRNFTMAMCAADYTFFVERELERAIEFIGLEGSRGLFESELASRIDALEVIVAAGGGTTSVRASAAAPMQALVHALSAHVVQLVLDFAKVEIALDCIDHARQLFRFAADFSVRPGGSADSAAAESQQQEHFAPGAATSPQYVAHLNSSTRLWKAWDEFEDRFGTDENQDELRRVRDHLALANRTATAAA